VTIFVQADNGQQQASFSLQWFESWAVVGVVSVDLRKA
jgi:hypothetical protein